MAIIAIIFWGIAIAPTKWALEAIQPFTLIFLRLVFAGVIFLPYVWIQRKQRKTTRTLPWKRLSILSFTGVGGYLFLFVYGISLTSGTHASIISSSLSLFIFVFSALYLKERVVGKQWLGLLFSLVGVFLIAIPSKIENNSASLTGDMFVLVSTILFAIYTIQMKQPQAEAELPSETFTALTLLIGAFTIFPFAAFETWQYGMPNFIEPKTWWSIAFLVVGSSSASYWLWNQAIDKISVITSGILLNAYPVVSVITSVLLLDETMTWKIGIGGGLVLIGILWIEKEKSKVQHQEQF